MKIISKLCVLGVLWFGLMVGDAFADVQLESGNFTVAYQEPMLNADGTPLTDLKETTIYYRLNNGSWVDADRIATSTNTGGGVVQKVIIINGLPEEVDVYFKYTASDFSGNESESYNEPVIRVDKIAPSSPTDIQ